MTGILAIDTATDACSVAVYVEGDIHEQYELIPREHSQRIFPMLQNLLPDGQLRERGIEAIAYSCGPGSFTGLRIAASLVQGLAYTNDLPCIAISTLALQAQSALRKELVEPDSNVLSMLDARINEVYYALVHFEEGLAVIEDGPYARAPETVALPGQLKAVHAVGSGAEFMDRLPETVSARVCSVHATLFPAAQDLIPLALAAYRAGEIQTPQQVQPLYVRDKISWKKLAEQGKQA